MVACASGMAERLGQQSIEVPANRVFLRQIKNIIVSVTYHNGSIDIFILEGKYKDSAQY